MSDTYWFPFPFPDVKEYYEDRGCYLSYFQHPEKGELLRVRNKRIGIISEGTEAEIVAHAREQITEG